MSYCFWPETSTMTFTPRESGPVHNSSKRRSTIWKSYWKGMRGYQRAPHVIARNKAERLRVKNVRRKANGLPPLTDYANV